jgi:hypothetical protein
VATVMAGAMTKPGCNPRRKCTGHLFRENERGIIVVVHGQ